MQSSSADGLRILNINNVTLAHSGEVQLVVTHPGKPCSSEKAYTTLAVIPNSNNNKTPATTPTKTHINNKDTIVDAREQQLFDLEPIDDQQHLEETTTTDAAKDHQRQLQQPACILEGPQDCTALIGGCVRLSVIYEGLPKPQIVWYKAVSSSPRTSPNIVTPFVLQFLFLYYCFPYFSFFCEVISLQLSVCFAVYLQIYVWLGGTFDFMAIAIFPPPNDVKKKCRRKKKRNSLICIFIF